MWEWCWFSHPILNEKANEHEKKPSYLFNNTFSYPLFSHKCTYTLTQSSTTVRHTNLLDKQQAVITNDVQRLEKTQRHSFTRKHSGVSKNEKGLVSVDCRLYDLLPGVILKAKTSFWFIIHVLLMKSSHLPTAVMMLALIIEQHCVICDRD